MNKIIKRASIRLEIGYTYFGFFQTIDKYNLNEFSKVWKKPKYNSLSNKCLVFDISTDIGN